MGANKVTLSVWLASGLLVGCGGDAGDPALQAAAEVPQTVAQQAAQVAQAAAPTPTDSATLEDGTRLARETFSYGGGSRDPFESLLNVERLGPELSDLQLVGVYYDADRPGNSVAVLRDKTTGRPYKLRRGEEVGRARVRQVRQRDVTFTIEDFGFERQETLSLPTREDATP